jgi:radical SAM superfamily enzyme YgiQ (UPF0313 family)
MRIALVKLPSLMSADSLSFHESAPSLGLAYIAAAIRQAGHNVQIIDAVGDDVKKYELYTRKKNLLLHGLSIADICDRILPDTEVVGISNMFLHEFHLLQDTVAAIKKRHPKIKVVIGGENATSLWDETMREIPGIDVCVLGEGENKIGLVLDAFKSGSGLHDISGIVYRDGENIVKTGPGLRLQELDSQPWPAWDIFPLESYFQAELNSGINRGRSIPMLTSRGCPFKCKFCSAPEMWTTKYVTRDPLDVVNEVEFYISKYNVSNIDFQDLTSFITKKWIKEFCELIEQRGLKFTWQIPQGSRSEVIDEDTADLLYRSGCSNYTFAPESGSERLLKLMKKKLSVPRIVEAMKTAKKRGMNVDANIIIATPEEIKSDHWATYKMIIKFALAGIDSIGVMTFGPYPGSEYYHQLRQSGELVLDEDYIYSSLLRASFNIKSYNPRFSINYILFVQYSFLLTFYGLLYLTHPWYLFRSIKNALTNKEESKMEQFLITKFKQMKTLRNLKANMKLSGS